MLVIIAHRFTYDKKIKHQKFSKYYESNCSTYQISGSVIKKVKSKAEVSQKQLLRKSYLTFITKVLVKNVTERALFLYYAITFSQVQTDISTNYFFFFFFAFVFLHLTKLYLLLWKVEWEHIFHIIHDIPVNLSHFCRITSISRLDH